VELEPWRSTPRFLWSSSSGTLETGLLYFLMKLGEITHHCHPLHKYRFVSVSFLRVTASVCPALPWRFSRAAPSSSRNPSAAAHYSGHHSQRSGKVMDGTDRSDDALPDDLVFGPQIISSASHPSTPRVGLPRPPQPPPPAASSAGLHPAWPG
jgi:hypothetical protein